MNALAVTALAALDDGAGAHHTNFSPFIFVACSSLEMASIVLRAVSQSRGNLSDGYFV